MELTKLINKMTLDEKIGQMFQSCVAEDSIDELCRQIENGEIGSCILTDNDIAGTSDEQIDGKLVQKIRGASQRSRLKIPVILGRDVIHGSKIIFPIPLAQAASFDTELGEEGAYRMAREAAKEGVEWTFSPMLDIAHDPRWGRVIEGFGEDPYLVSQFAAAFVKGIQKAGMAACAKHFIGYSACEGGVDYANAEITDYTLRNTYLPPFRAAVNAGVATVMNSFGNIGGMPSVANEYIFRDILKDELGFDGFVISDWGSIEWQLYTGTAADKAECAENALKAGIDMEMVTQCYRESLKNLVKEGKVDIGLIDDAVLRILKIKEKYCGNAVIDYAGVCLKEDYDFAEKFALNCAVLLKNNNDVLPLENKKFILSGPFTHEIKGLFGSWHAGSYDNCSTFYEELMKIYEDNVILDDSIHKIKAKMFDVDTVVLALGDDYSDTGERASMAHIEIDETQLILAKRAKQMGKKVIAVVFAGRPLVLSELEIYADSIIYMWHGGAMSARAAVKIISGEFNPCAKTPITFLRNTGQIPMYYNGLPLPIREPEEYGYYCEPRFSAYNDERSTPLYPFGFGLSYTNFEFSNMKCDKKQLSAEEMKNGKCFDISVEIENIGDMDGAEICQLYIRDVVSKIARPIKELKKFKKVFIKKNEKVYVNFKVGIDELGYYPQKELVLEKGEFYIYLGNSCLTDSKILIEVI